MSASVEYVKVKKLSNQWLMAVWYWIGVASTKEGQYFTLGARRLLVLSNELVLAMEMVEGDCGFALVFVDFNALCWGRI